MSKESKQKEPQTRKQVVDQLKKNLPDFLKHMDEKEMLWFLAANSMDILNSTTSLINSYNQLVQSLQKSEQNQHMLMQHINNNLVEIKNSLGIGKKKGIITNINGGGHA